MHTSTTTPLKVSVAGNCREHACRGDDPLNHDRSCESNIAGVFPMRSWWEMREVAFSWVTRPIKFECEFLPGQCNDKEDSGLNIRPKFGAPGHIVLFAPVRTCRRGRCPAAEASPMHRRNQMRSGSHRWCRTQQPPRKQAKCEEKEGPAARFGAV